MRAKSKEYYDDLINICENRAYDNEVVRDALNCEQ